MGKRHVLLLVVMFLCAATGKVAGTNHIVGKSLGWTIPKNASYYQDWASRRNFTVGDKLVFLFSTGVHNVVEVSKEDYEACTQKKTVDVHFTGPTILEITLIGDHYYICGLRRHCLGGQKLSIKALASTDNTLHSKAISYHSPTFTLPSLLPLFLLFLFL